jgi:hypothetical protein
MMSISERKWREANGFTPEDAPDAEESQRRELEAIRRRLADPRRDILRDIVNRLERPRFYAGDWAGDMADRIIDALDKIENL